MPSPVDGSIWYTVGIFGGPPGVLRFGSATGLSEVYNVPPPAFGIRGGDIDKNGVLWGSLSSGHLGSFDRRKCKGPLNGPNATGNHCPEGWTIYQYPGPGFEGVGENSAESSYYTWVDQHNTSGLGENIPMSTANLGDGFVALKGRQDDHDPDSLSAQLLCQGLRRVDRRSECRLERPRIVEHEWRPHALAQGRRQGLNAARRAHPVSARSAGELRFAETI
jgi:hypothetical protein